MHLGQHTVGASNTAGASGTVGTSNIAGVSNIVGASDIASASGAMGASNLVGVNAFPFVVALLGKNITSGTGRTMMTPTSFWVRAGLLA